jgi:histone H2A
MSSKSKSTKSKKKRSPSPKRKKSKSPARKRSKSPARRSHAARGRKKDTSQFHTYIYGVLKQVHPDTGLSGKAKSMLNEILKLIVRKIMKAANDLSAGKDTVTLSSRIILAAVRVVCYGELANHSANEGNKALTKYQSSLGSKAAGGKTRRAGLIISVPRIEKLIRKNTVMKRVGQGAPIYVAAVVEYLLAEIIELSGNAARDNKFMRIKPRHIKLAIANDAELNELFCDTVFGAGVIPHIEPSILPKGKGKKGKRIGGEY